ncbi:hypothetical protein [Streptomyces cuspidosporus]|uniref:hypothetical protein n=1 Tax=Streptomyces cuspidosporus TaxID=66882 RepID=UPI0031FD9993
MNRSPQHDDDVARLWQEHLLAAFPADLRGAELAGVDMALLDASIAGCVSTWKDNGGVLVTDLASHRAVLDEQQLRLCGLAARRLLEYLWTQPPAPASRLAVTAVIQTAASDLTATEMLLRRAVESPQLEERGYNDLDSMNSNISELMDLLPGLAEDLYVAMLSHTETSSASTQLGSGSVFTLVSNRRQDFDAAKYPLVEHFPAVLRSHLPRALTVLTRLAVTGRTAVRGPVVSTNYASPERSLTTTTLSGDARSQ